MRSDAAWTAAAALAVLALAAVVLRVAWIGDDAYITLRTVENWLAGHGPVWNPGERVQAFTHPLWLLLLTAARALSGESYFTVIGLSLALAAAAVFVLLRGSGPPTVMAMALLLLGSHAFVEYATSGLENPLVYLLLALFAANAAGAADGTATLGRLALLSALLATTRMDLALLCLPVLAVSCRGVAPAAAVRRLAAGGLPFAAWLAFAAFYYGSPFPVTAYAKIATGVPRLDLVAQGLRYLWHAVVHDPVTVAVLAAGAGLGLLQPRLRARPLALGVLLYCAYVVWVGGDFMAGRFLTPPFLAAAFVAARWLAGRGAAAHLLAAAAALLLLFLPPLPGVPHWLSAPAADPRPTESWHGILDECRFYYPEQGLFSPARDLPVAGRYSRAMRAAGRNALQVMTWGKVGRFAYEAGDLVHVVDPWLLDPLLMRLPVPDPGQWRIGHFIRRIPEGYLETLATGEARIHHEGLRRYYATLRAVIREPLFAGHRLRALVRLWRGADDRGLRDYVAGDYRRPPRLPVGAAELDPPVAAGTPWFADPRVRTVGRGGLAVTLRAPATARALRVTVATQARYELRLLRQGAVVATLAVDAADASRFQDLPEVVARVGELRRRCPELFGSLDCLALLANGGIGMQEVTAAVPAGAGAFDVVWVDAPGLPAHQVAALGGLVLAP